MAFKSGEDVVVRMSWAQLERALCDRQKEYWHASWDGSEALAAAHNLQLARSEMRRRATMLREGAWDAPRGYLKR